MPEESIASAEFREVGEGNLAQKKRVTYPLAPFLAEPARSRYLHYKRRWSSIREKAAEIKERPALPNTFEKTRYCREMVAAHGSEVAVEAVRSGNVSMLSFLTGLTNREVELSSARTFMRLLSEMRRDGFLGLFVGDTDNGKTNTALWLSLLCLLDQISLGRDVVFATNIESLEWSEPDLDERTIMVRTTSALQAVCEKHEKVVCVLDELEIEANATTNNHAVNEHFGNVLTFKSKSGLVLFPIFHRTDGIGAAPVIREHASYFLKQVREMDDIEGDEYRVSLYNEHSAENGFAKKAYEFEVPRLQPDGDYDPDERAQFRIDA